MPDSEAPFPPDSSDEPTAGDESHSSQPPTDEQPVDEQPAAEPPAADSPTNVPARDESPSPNLHVAAERLGMQLLPDQLDQAAAYAELLWQWNEKINLTRHTDWDSFATRDLWDSIHLAKLLPTGVEVLDFGSGGGIPGVLLAIFRPDVQVSLCESVGKKAAALDDMIGNLRLPCPVYACRAEEVLEDFRFHTLTCRAVGPLAKICGWFADLWINFDQLLLIKGPAWVEERGEARHRGALQGVQLRRVLSYPMVGTESESVILKLWDEGSDEPETIEIE